MQNELNGQIENVARKYGFVPRIGTSDEHAYNNKNFLAMLDEYVGKTQSELPDSVRLIDIGCREMNYADALITFFEKYGKTDKKTRPVHVVGVEGAGDFMGFEWEPLRKAIKEGRLSPAKLDLIYQWIDKKEDMDYISEETGIEKYDAATIFAAGPDAKLTLAAGAALASGDPENREFAESVKRGGYITRPIEQTIRPRMAENGLLIVTTVYDGAPRERVLESIEKAGLDVLLSEENKFTRKFRNWSDRHKYIIVAKNKP